MASKKSLPPDSIFKYLSKREKVACTKLDESAKEAFCARRLPMVWKERALPVGELDKIFSSTWLDGNNVICGTKCNNVSECFELTFPVYGAYLDVKLQTVWPPSPLISLQFSFIGIVFFHPSVGRSYEDLERSSGTTSIVLQYRPFHTLKSQLRSLSKCEEYSRNGHIVIRLLLKDCNFLAKEEFL